MDSSIKHYLVGGYVRDYLLGVPSKDKDYAVEAPSFPAMKFWLEDQGAKIYQEREEFNTIRARLNGEDVDFVLCRKDGPYTDHRHPDWTTNGTLMDDLARRDFTINAIAQDPLTGNFIDPHGGVSDLEIRVIRAVGNPEKRLEEDPLRAFRAIRFSITKNMRIDDSLKFEMNKVRLFNLMDSVATDRIRDELFKMFRHDSVGSMIKLVHEFPAYLGIIDQRGIWFKPTSEEK